MAAYLVGLQCASRTAVQELVNRLATMEDTHGTVQDIISNSTWVVQPFTVYKVGLAITHKVSSYTMLLLLRSSL